MSHPRDRILSAALAEFEERGLRDATIERIAARAGLGRATLYRYFPRRDALLGALVLHEARVLFEKLDETLQLIDDPAEGFEQGLLLAIAHLRGHTLLRSVLDREPEQLLPLLTVRSAPLLAAAIDFAVPHIERVAKAGGVKNLDARVAAEWAARVLLSLLLVPSPTVDLDDPKQVRAFVGWLTDSIRRRTT